MEIPSTPLPGTNELKTPQKDGDTSPTFTSSTSKPYSKTLLTVETYFEELAKRSKDDREFQRELTNMLLFGFTPAQKTSKSGFAKEARIRATRGGRKSKKNGSTSTSSTRTYSPEVVASSFVPPETVHQAKRLFKERLILKMASPIVEKLARRYAEATLTKHHVSMQDLGDEVGISEKHVASIVSRKEFPMVLQKYLPVEDAMERHKELMNQDEDLGVAAKMVELAYKAHGVTGDKGEKPKSDFANFLQQINYNYGADNEGATSRPVVEVRTSVQNQEQEGADSTIDAQQGAERVR